MSFECGGPGLLAKTEVKDLGGIHWPILYERGLVAKQRGDIETALKFFKESAEAIEKVRSSISIESSKIGFAGSKQAVYQDLVLAATAKGDWTMAFEYAERAKARAFVDMLAQKTDLAAPLAADEKIVALLASAEDREPILAIFDTDGLTRSAVIEARTQLNQVAPEAASLIAVNNVPLSDVTSRLSSKEVLINYYIAEKDLYAFLLSSTGIKGFKLSAEGLEEEIRDFRSALQSAEANADTLGKSLYGRLIAPLEGDFKGARLTISPHGILHYLPFAALTDGSKYVVDKYSVRVMPSANSLAYVRSDKPIKTGKMLAFGNPELGNPRLDLPSAQDEAIRVAKMFPASKALVRKDASKTALKELGSGFSILHIASHGEFDSDAPLNSGLLLAKTEADEGRLTVSDLYSIRLDAELVTLSACETGLGKVASGDDVVGLTRGFMYAGARSIVSSLWQVDDAATATLMQGFYRNLAKNIDKREALRLAQVETKKSHPHPFYWGAFQITGAAN